MRVPMVSIYKPRNRAAEHHPWLLAYPDAETGKRVVKRSVPDLELARAQAMEISRRLQAVKCGLLSQEQIQRQRWAKTTLAEHLADWGRALEARGGTLKHVELCRQRAGRVIEALGAGSRVEGLTPAAVQVAIDGMLHEHFTRVEVKLSAASRNHYLRAIKMLSRWMWSEGRIERDLLVGLHPWNSETELRHQRRALTECELEQLLTTAESGPDHAGMTGRQRALCYRVAVETGLRAGELRAVTTESLALNGDFPCIVLEARYSKHRRRDVVVLTTDLAQELKAMLSESCNSPLFPLPVEAGRVLAFDLKAAGIEREHQGLYVDFHSLRHTAITRMVNATGNLRLAQQFARHSTPTLTARYAHVELSDLSAAVESLPKLVCSSGLFGVQRPAQRTGAS